MVAIGRLASPAAVALFAHETNGTLAQICLVGLFDACGAVATRFEIARVCQELAGLALETGWTAARV